MENPSIKKNWFEMLLHVLHNVKLAMNIVEYLILAHLYASDLRVVWLIKRPRFDF